MKQICHCDTNVDHLKAQRWGSD